jgi:Rod binding domain-containing protein
MNPLDALTPTSPPMDALMQRTSPVRSRAEMQALSRDPAKIRQAAEGFEEVLLQKLLDEMQKTVPDGELFNDSGTQQVRSLFNMMLAKHVASSGGIGLADELSRQFSQMADITAPPTANTLERTE